MYSAVRKGSLKGLMTGLKLSDVCNSGTYSAVKKGLVEGFDDWFELMWCRHSN
jgi:hypothetical protein